ncbi:P13 [Artaxa digramma nucleopolyhedrovirus]|uniref:P13 n=1 Tax=Artaxa digramma nucleopolyhedrovirus TaxID=3070910 RepID=A0AAE6R6H7_9ABAC|nr:P13 [Euproctis digramma nucleopolyhedrovirus]QHB21763.1 P13 [Artaxa digramma nucleopolyhedrovirus]
MYAYVTLVMLNDDYVPGAVALAKSLLLTGTEHDLICMVTPHISQEAVDTLAQVYDKIVRVDCLHYKCPPMLTKRQNQMYGPWIEYAFTKWQCLNLVQYKKIVYLDADHLVVKNVDHLFALPAPAMCFTDENYGYYDKFAYGQQLSPQTISNFMKYFKILCKGGTVLFEPDKVLFETIVGNINDQNQLLYKNIYHNGYDEQVLLQALIQLKKHVTQLSVLYVWNAGSYQRLSKNCEPYIINYYGDAKTVAKRQQCVFQLHGCVYLEILL